MTAPERPSLFIVDDEPEIVMLLRALLEKNGYGVVSASNGAAALRLLGLEPFDPAAAMPDLLILDIMMPVMDGYALNSRLQSDDRARKIPVLILTARGQQMRELFERAPNVAAYVQKPFNPKTLLDLIADLLSGKTARPKGAPR